MQESQPQEKKDEPLEKVLSELKTEFSGDESITFSIEKKENGAGLLHADFLEQEGLNAISNNKNIEESTLRRVNKVLLNNQFESRYRGGGNWSRWLLIDPKFVDGKINWRRWIPQYKDKEFSVTTIDLLDEASSYLELSNKIDEKDTDDYGKFLYFIRMAPLIQSEKEKIEGEIQSVFR